MATRNLESGLFAHVGLRKRLRKEAERTHDIQHKMEWRNGRLVFSTTGQLVPGVQAVPKPARTSAAVQNPPSKWIPLASPRLNR